MEVTNVIMRKPIFEEQRRKGLVILSQFSTKLNRMTTLAQKLDTGTATTSEMAECLSLVTQAETCAKLLGFADHMSMCRYIDIYGIESL